MNLSEIKTLDEEKLLQIQQWLEEKYNNDSLGVYEPKRGSDYYCINEGHISKYIHTGHEVDYERLALGNCFLTIESAESHIKKLRIERKMKILSKKSIGSEELSVLYFPVLRGFGENKYLEINTTTYDCRSRDIFFRSENDCTEALEEIGSENMIKYYFKQ